MSADIVAGSGAASKQGAAGSKGSQAPADPSFVPALADALVDRALAEEVIGFDEDDRIEAARFVAACAERRPPGIALVRLETLGGKLGQRRMRICIVNDDMPFLVDSVAGAIAGRGLTIHRLLHPVVCAERDEQGCLRMVEPICDDSERRESILYIEADRTDARGRQELIADLHRVLADVRASVSDWQALQDRMHEQAEQVSDAEGRALLHWFADGAMTLLGYQVESPGASPSEALGLLKIPGEPVWDEGSCKGALAYFEGGGAEPLVAKADRTSTVHRRVPFDLVVLPVRREGRIAAIAIDAGLWTSQAL